MKLTTGLAVLCLIFSQQFAEGAEKRPPNVIVIFADDLGYGDLGCYGHPEIRTPHLDKLAADGVRFTSFYVAASVCTPSRAGILTGRLPVRTGMCSDKRRVLFPNSAGGLPASELTIAEVLKTRGYATAAIGKWHLGHLPEFLPTRQGFDSYFGIPYSNDMDRVNDSPMGREAFWKPKSEYWNVPILENEKVVERPARQETITKRYTERAVEFIQANKEKPFFIYLAHSLPHVPLFASDSFLGKSPRGLYGDVVEEIDWSVGQIQKAVKDAQLDDNTLIVFTSDNGPWLIFNEHGGSAGLLREGKGCTWEGGMRVPGIMKWTGKIRAGQVSADIVSSLDILPTAAALAGAKLPENLVLDGYDLSKFLTEQAPCPRQEMFYYRGTHLYAVRQGAWKAHFRTQTAYGKDDLAIHQTPVLNHLTVDPSEKYNVAQKHPEVIEKINHLVQQHEKSMLCAPTQLEKMIQNKK
ncbi:MAG: sulfatase [Zavarzinella sp.]